MLKAERNVTVLLENLIWVESEPEANQMLCFTLLIGSEMKRITLPEAFNYED